MADREQLAFRAASMYYLQDETMDTVARHLGVSRSTVSRLLAHARDTGLVRITLADPTHRDTLTHRLESELGVRARVVPVRAGTTDIHRLEQVAAVAGDLVTQWMEPGTVLGLAWGTTIAEVVAELPPRPVPRTTVVQLNGAASALRTGLPYADAILSQAARAYGARTVLFPVPAFFDHVDTRAAMWRERSVQRVLAIQEQCDLVVFGVGALSGPVPSQVHQGGYLSEDDRRQLAADGVVGDVCTVFMRADGSWRDITLNRRATGPTPAQLSRVRRRLLVAAGAAKAAGTLAALRARVATDLVLDDAAAREVLELAGGSGPRGERS